MGVDIHMKLIDKYGNIVIEDLYDGRNPEWFDNLMNRGYGEEYDELPRISGIPEVVDDKTREIYNKENHGCYYGFYHMKMTDFVDWFNKYRPDMSAGWVRAYDAWAYEHKGVIPDLYRYLDNEDIIEEMRFIEVVNPYDPNRLVMDRLVEYSNNNPWVDLNGALIVYYFNC